MLLVIISPFPRSVAWPGRHFDSGAAAAQATEDHWQHTERVPEGEPHGGVPGFAVFSLALQVPEWFWGVGVVKDVPAGGFVKDAFHVFLL